MRRLIDRILTALFPLPKLESKTSVYRAMFPPLGLPADLLSKVEAGWDMTKPKKQPAKEKKIRIFKRKTV
jgi:hypothetical protein